MSDNSDTPLILARTNRLLLTPKEAAAALSVSTRTLWAMTWPRGVIRPVRLGRSVRYSLESLKALIGSQQDSGPLADEGV
jgi:excisionase family DNA binding protein